MDRGTVPLGSYARMGSWRFQYPFGVRDDMSELFEALKDIGTEGWIRDRVSVT